MLTRELIQRTFTKLPTLDTERLQLRQILPTDTEDMFAYASKKEVTRYLLWSPHPTRAYTEKYIAYLQERYRAGDFYDWAVVLKDTGRMVGTCGFTKFDVSSNSAEVGYVLNPSVWGQGYATEALTAVLRFGFQKLHLHRAEACYLEENTASRRVMERAGMKFEGIRRDSIIVKGHYRNVGVCSVLAEEFPLP